MLFINLPNQFSVMNDYISELFERMLSFKVLIDAIERGEPSDWLLDIMKMIHDTGIGSENIGDKSTIETLKNMEREFAEKFAKELEKIG